MPAVTVDDLTALPRLHAPGLGDTVRPVRSVTTCLLYTSPSPRD